MRLHLVGLPHTQTTYAYSSCAFTEKLRKLANMMTGRGHEVILYAGDQNEAAVSELVTCYTEEERKAVIGDRHFSMASFDSNAPHWQRFNSRVAAEIIRRARPGEFVCVIGGSAQRPLADALAAFGWGDDKLKVVEFGIGYAGSFAHYRVFESLAWMHTLYGAGAGPGGAGSAQGGFFDDVIPGYFEPELFPLKGAIDWDNLPVDEVGPNRDTRRKIASMAQKPFFLFVGRMTHLKGPNVVAQVCEKLGAPLILAGPRDGAMAIPGYGEYIGEIGPHLRGALMASATAFIMPTLYIEPFGNVAVEAQASGTPVITTAWGAMTETVLHGKTGWHCRGLGDFMDACSEQRLAQLWSPEQIRQRVVDTYSVDVIAERYERYFERLSTLFGEGWNSERSFLGA